MKQDETPSEVQNLIARGALFVINHSAGKDSQAMTLILQALVPSSQLLAVHADLGEVEWDGNVDHIRATIGDYPLIVCRNDNKTFLEMVERRGMWPSPSQRQCTSDLKRGPIEREIRRHLKAHPEFGGLVVNCMGIRAAESPARSKQTPFRKNEGNSIAGREWYDWLPIFGLSTADVFSMIERAGQEPHPAYKAGMTRLSCVFCIMASRADLQTAAALKPNLYRRYVELEKRLGHTMSMERKPLEEVTGIYLEDDGPKAAKKAPRPVQTSFSFT
jgi:3'-phosphoadenosine 5'-phosphosulfate sulfotransferase (PAPS reductase)/FAD synthetase